MKTHWKKMAQYKALEQTYWVENQSENLQSCQLTDN